MIGKLCFHELNFVKCAGPVVIQKGCFKNFRTLNAAHDLLFTNTTALRSALISFAFIRQSRRQ